MPAANSLTIFLPKRLNQTGGTSTFARNFQRGMAERGHTVVFNWQSDYDILLASPTAPLRYLLHAKAKGRLILQRLDGVYYPGSSAGWLWRLLNLQLSMIRSIFADALIYQSKYSEQISNERLLPVRNTLPKKLIYNGVDTTVFSPNGKNISLKDNPEQQLIITASRFRTPDQIIPLLKSFSIYRKEYQKNSKLIIIGPFEEQVSDIPHRHKESPGVIFLGTTSHQDLPKYLRAADVFIMTHKTPPCPNNILEAMACGLPICGVADGAMPELVSNGVEGELIPEPANTKSFPIGELARRLHVIMQERANYANHARLRAEHDFQLATMLNAYDLWLQHCAQSQLSKNLRSQ